MNREKIQKEIEALEFAGYTSEQDERKKKINGLKQLLNDGK